MEIKAVFPTVVLILVIIAVGIAICPATAEDIWTKDRYLYSGQSVIYEIPVDNSAQMVLNGPNEADFDLYAMKGAMDIWP